MRVRNTLVNKREKGLYPHGVHMLMGEVDTNHNKSVNHIVSEAGVSAGASRRDGMRTTRWCEDLKSVVSQETVSSVRTRGYTVGGLVWGEGSPRKLIQTPR